MENRPVHKASNLLAEDQPSIAMMRSYSAGHSHQGLRILTGDGVYDEEGAYVGEIVELMVDPLTGQVGYAVTAVGGFLGLGRRTFAIPWRFLEPDIHHQRCILRVDYDHWVAAAERPDFD